MVKRKNAVVDILRFLFALIIICFHANQLNTGLTIFKNGRLVVEFFFIVSGYLMVKSSKRYEIGGPLNPNGGAGSSTFQFIKHKIFALTPNYFIALFTAMVLFAVVDRWNGIELIRNLSGGIFESMFLKSAGFSDVVKYNGVTWYISAMLLAMSILFPILIKKRDFYLKWLTPMLCIFIYGFLSKTSSNGLCGPGTWYSIVTKAVLRAIAGIALGAVVYSLSNVLKNLKITTFFRILLTLVEVLSIVFFVYYIYKHACSYFDFVLVAILAIGMIIIFSETSYVALINKSNVVQKVSSFLGKMSLNMYLVHGYLYRRFPDMFPNMSGKKLFLLFIGMVIANAFILMFLSDFLKKKWPSIKKAFVKEN